MFIRVLQEQMRGSTVECMAAAVESGELPRRPSWHVKGEVKRLSSYDEYE
jgi:hypothetical protein